MAKYLIEIIPSAEKELDRLDYKAQDKIIEKIQSLENNPYPSGVIKMKNAIFYRIRVGDYRILFQVDANVIYIMKIGHRKDVYK